MEFSQKEEKNKQDEYRRRFIRLVIAQENEIEDEIDDAREDIERLVRENSGREIRNKEKIDIGFKDILQVWVASYLATLVKFNASTAGLVGEQQQDLISKEYHNPKFNRLIAKDAKSLEEVIRKTFPYRKFPTDGVSIGDRIKTVQGEALKTLRDIVEVGIREGKSAKQIADDLDNFLKPKDNMTWVGPFEWYRKRFGYKIKKVPIGKPAGSLYFNSIRIARTEINHTYRQSTVILHKNKPWVRGYVWNLSHAHPKPDICDEWAKGSPYKSADEVLSFGHPYCYDKQTEVYTQRGWVKFEYLYKYDKILSLNPQTFDLEFLSPVHYIKYKYRGKMVHFKGDSVNLLVTPHHKMFVRKNGSKEYKLLRADEVDSNDKLYFVSNWTGKKVPFIKIGNSPIDTKLFCRFLAYYLSSGSIKRSKKSIFQIFIKQGIKSNQERYNIIRDDLLKLPYRLDCLKNGFVIHSKDLGAFLIGLGIGYKRFIPYEIKCLSKEYLYEILKAFCSGYGNFNGGKSCAGKYFNDDIVYYASYKRLADDIGELVLKCGFQPSFCRNRLRECTSKSNNKYGNFIFTTIKNRNNKSSNGFTIEEVDYDDYVYDVELPKNHILWVRRGGKTAWSGNCMCFITVDFVRPEDLRQ